MYFSTLFMHQKQYYALFVYYPYEHNKCKDTIQQAHTLQSVTSRKKHGKLKLCLEY